MTTFLVAPEDFGVLGVWWRVGVALLVLVTVLALLIWTLQRWKP